MSTDNPFAHAEVGEESRELNAAKGWHPATAATSRDRGAGAFKGWSCGVPRSSTVPARRPGARSTSWWKTIA